jgi:hypothetical protein
MPEISDQDGPEYAHCRVDIQVDAQLGDSHGSRVGTRSYSSQFTSSVDSRSVRSGAIARTSPVSLASLSSQSPGVGRNSHWQRFCADHMLWGHVRRQCQICSRLIVPFLPDGVWLEPLARRSWRRVGFSSVTRDPASESGIASASFCASLASPQSARRLPRDVSPRCTFHE